MEELSYKNKSIYYKKIGNPSGKVLLFLHGFMENTDLWLPFLSSFSEKYQVLMIDFPGHGASECISETHTMDLLAEVVFSVLQKEELTKVHLVGHSMGGYVALAFAEKYPQYLASVTLLNSTAMPDSEEKKKNRERTIEAVQRNKTIFIRTAIPNLFSEENQQKLLDTINDAISHIEKTSVCGIIAASKGMKERSNRIGTLSNISVPKLYIIGENDALFSIPEMIAEAKQTQSNYVLLPGGHMSFLECPDETKKILENFFENV